MAKGVVLITGSNGEIGHSLIQRLHDEGRHSIVSLDLTPAPDDYDRFPDPMTTIVVPRIPSEGREVYVKIGYSY